jgi:hypothetical protein
LFDQHILFLGSSDRRTFQLERPSGMCDGHVLSYNPSTIFDELALICSYLPIGNFQAGAGIQLMQQAGGVQGWEEQGH